MGSWGTDVFDSDDAADLVGDLAEAPDPGALLAEALDGALAPGDEAEAPEMTAGLAAAALVACALGGSLPAPGPARDLLAGGRLGDVAGLRDRARAVLDRGLTDDGTEWAELWDEAGELDEVRDHLQAHRALLG
jgi:Domain of unknown function (DUF4259)